MGDNTCKHTGARPPPNVVTRRTNTIVGKTDRRFAPRAAAGPRRATANVHASNRNSKRHAFDCIGIPVHSKLWRWAATDSQQEAACPPPKHESQGPWHATKSRAAMWLTRFWPPLLYLSAQVVMGTLASSPRSAGSGPFAIRRAQFPRSPTAYRGCVQRNHWRNDPPRAVASKAVFLCLPLAWRFTASSLLDSAGALTVLVLDTKACCTRKPSRQRGAPTRNTGIPSGNLVGSSPPGQRRRIRHRATPPDGATPWRRPCNSSREG